MKRWKTGGLIRASCDSYWPASRLQQLSPIECLAVTDAVERWWTSPIYHIPREEETYEQRCIRVGLIRPPRRSTLTPETPADEE
jgi:hypothetical protein